MAKALTVYQASAGSGKTFRLAIEYIKLLIENPLSYRTILAVTFTNKATEEMKMRILSQLYGLSHGLESSEKYLECIIKETSFSEKIVRHRAGESLEHLLHNYQYFKVQTIDTFFQSVLRNLARELDLNANLRIEINDIQVEQEAVDELLESLHRNQEVMRWIMDFIFERMADDKSWNITSELKDFGKNIFSEAYKLKRHELETNFNHPSFFTELIKELNIQLDTAKRFFRNIISDFDTIEQRYGLTVDSYRYKKTGPCTYFYKLKEGNYTDAILGARVTEALNDPKKWFSDKNKADIGSELTELVQRCEGKRKTLLLSYYSALVTLKNIYKIGLLRHIESMVREKNKQAGRFLLSDTQALLHEMIDTTVSPFIFEKIGTVIKHIMIDEFQDTSAIQWANFKVLLEECMAKAESASNGITQNLIVGDVKQSIYRFRNGDWKLLNNIDKTFPSRQIDIIPLSDNYRSYRNIIEFNNLFFTFANNFEIQKLKEDIKKSSAPFQQQDRDMLLSLVDDMDKAYDNVCQTTPPSRPSVGYVEIELLPSKSSEDESAGYDERMIEKVKSAILQLVNQQHIPPAKIAILTRKKNHIRSIADTLMNDPEFHVRLVSAEAYQLQSSPAIRLLVAAMYTICHPTELYYNTLLADLYQLYIQNNKQFKQEAAVPQCHIVSLDSGSVKSVYLDEIQSRIPATFVEELPALAAMSLPDMLERLTEILHIGHIEGQGAYLCFFHDELMKFAHNNAGHLIEFLEHWETSICTKCISVTATDGIQLLTIHQSKGLEFDHVILPFCDWSIEDRRNVFWAFPEVDPYSRLVALPFNYSKVLLQTIYATDYKKEHLQSVIDNMNLLYVAFTRAKKSLMVYGRNGKFDNVWSSRSAVIKSFLEENGVKGDEQTTIRYSLGTPIMEEPVHSVENIQNIFEQLPEPINIDIATERHPVHFLQSNKSRRFIAGDEDASPSGRQQYIQLGNILHAVFSRIRTVADVASVLQELTFEGLLNKLDVEHDKLLEQIHKSFQNPQVASWFSDRWQLFNECSIISSSPEDGTVITHRPDRVMIDGNKVVVVDFKFGQPHVTHIQQVQQYMQLLSMMGHSDLEGYIWYVFKNQVNPVTLHS